MWGRAPPRWLAGHRLSTGQNHHNYHGQHHQSKCQTKIYIFQGPFACKDGTTLTSSQVCDGVPDCGLAEDAPGGEDEEDCSGDGPDDTSSKQLSADLMNMGSPCYAKDTMSINQQEDDLTQPMRCMPTFKNVVANQRVRVSTNASPSST